MGAAGLVGGGEAIAAGLADGVTAAFVLVVGGDVADRLMEADGVVVEADPFELGGQDLRVGDRQQVRVLGLDVAPQRLDPRLVGRGATRSGVVCLYRMGVGMRRLLPHVQRASGGLLIVAGLYAGWYGTYELILNAGRDIPSGPVGIVTDLSGRISRIVGDTGPVTIGVGAGLLLITALTATTLLGRRHPPDDDSTQDLAAAPGPGSQADTVSAGR